MGFELVLTNDTEERLDDGLQQSLQHVADLALRAEGMPEGVEIGLSLVDDGAIAQLNAEYRNVAASTDVLSFPVFDDRELELLRSDESAFPERPLLLGDVVISVPTARRQANEYGHDFRREMAFLFLHGLLHLLGHDHDEEEARGRMRAVEESILDAAGLSREREMQ